MPLDVSSASDARRAYWSGVLRRTLLLLAIWLVAGLGLGVLLVDRLDAVALPGGMPLGFWISQQGAIVVFVGLIFLNALLADRQERRSGAFGMGERERGRVGGDAGEGDAGGDVVPTRPRSPRQGREEGAR